MSRLTLFIIVLLVGALGVGAYLLRPDDRALSAKLTLSEALGGDVEGYARAYAPRPFVFPEDHGPHNDYKLEWWYYTGNVATASGRRFGYQFTLFRTALTPPGTVDTSRASAWATNQLYTAHLALTDVAGERFYAFERSGRGAAGLAGAYAEPFRVWLENWEVKAAALPDTSDGRTPPMRLRAETDGIALDLTMQSMKPVVLQGEDGLSRKSATPGNASYYYSMTRLATTGTVSVASTPYAVAGLSWMDREWSTSLLDTNQVGWDWFAFHFDDGRDFMYGRLRTQTPNESSYAFGTLVDADGRVQHLDGGDVWMTMGDTWTSPATGAVYPIRWRVQVPRADLDLQLAAQIPNQELNISVRYWEGAVRLEGTAAGVPLTGTGYMELTGYADEAAARRSGAALTPR